MNLPSLDSLLFFEAAARHGNFTRAAEELNVSQAAVSKRIKSLEQRLGIELVIRNGRTITLTQSGQKLALNASEALEFLNSTITQLRENDTEKFSLASNTTVAQFWLTPRINEYLISSNAVPITLTASDRDIDLLNQDNDAVILYGSTVPTGWEGTILFNEVWLPVAAPELLHETSDISSLKLLDFDKLTPKWINWPHFLTLAEFPEFKNSNRVKLGSYGSTVDAALRGKGIALGCPSILHHEIEAGRLQALDDFKIQTGRSYFVIWRAGQETARTRDLLRDLEITI